MPPGATGRAFAGASWMVAWSTGRVAWAVLLTVVVPTVVALTALEPVR